MNGLLQNCDATQDILAGLSEGEASGHAEDRPTMI